MLLSSDLSAVWLAELVWSVWWAPRSGPAAAEGRSPGQAQPPVRGSGEARGGTWAASFPTWRIYWEVPRERQRLCGGLSVTLSQEQPRENTRVCLEAKCFPLWLHWGLHQPGPAWERQQRETSGCPGKGGWGRPAGPVLGRSCPFLGRTLMQEPTPSPLPPRHPALQLPEVPARFSGRLSGRRLQPDSNQRLKVEKGGWKAAGFTWPWACVFLKGSQRKAPPTFAGAPSTGLRAAESLILPLSCPEKFCLRQ